MNRLEENFTSTGLKLLRHPDVLHDMQQGNPRPIVCHVMPTSKCNLKCTYCSVRNRPPEQLSLDDVLTFLGRLSERKLQAVIISGGGNPLLWPDLSECIISAHNDLGLEVGLITNGGTEKIWEGLTAEATNCLRWIRWSLSAIDTYSINQSSWDLVPPPHRHDGLTYGCSYIWSDYSEEHFTQTLDLLEAIPTQGIDLRAPEYIRLLPDCTDVGKLRYRIGFLADIANMLGSPPFFAQNKLPKAPQRCWLGWVHPVLNTDGYVYPCDSLVLNPGADHHFHSDWRQCHMDEVLEWYDDGGLRSLVKPQEMCPNCVFTRQNEILDAVMMPIPHEEFI
jgi:MoaA/NifB/PqqE/SkfB family radical SAM enzyme